MTFTWVAPREANITYWVHFGRTSLLDFGFVRGEGWPMGLESRSMVWRAELTGVRPGATYFYSVGTPDRAWTAIYHFTTALATPWDFTFAAIGDTGTRDVLDALYRRVMATDPASVVDVGDLSYADGNQTLWDRRFDMTEPLASTVAFMPVAGNHEVEDGTGLTAYLERFNLPPDANPADPGGSKLYYSFDCGNLHFVALHAAVEGEDYPGGNWYHAEAVWLQRDLSRASAGPDKPWIIVYFHYPLFTTAEFPDNWVDARDTWGHLFDQYGVDLVINGHVHAYERTYPALHDGTVYTNASLDSDAEGPAPIYVITGGGGAYQHAFPNASADWSAVRRNGYEFLSVHCHGQNLTVTTRAVSNGAVLDRFTIGRLSARDFGLVGASYPDHPLEPVTRDAWFARGGDMPRSAVACPTRAERSPPLPRGLRPSTWARPS